MGTSPNFWERMMPKPVEGRTMAQEAWVAQRVKSERLGRRWSLEEVARRMADVGCPIPISAIHKIEKSDPPRRISLNEFLALASVFDIPPDDLMKPPDAVSEAAAKELVDEWEAARDAAADQIRHLYFLHEKLATQHPEAAEQVRERFGPDLVVRLPNGETLSVKFKGDQA